MSLLLFLLCAAAGAETPAETFGCEATPTGDPIGGGKGYRKIFTKGDFTVTTAKELLAALKWVKPGQVIFVPDGAEIDLTGHRNTRLSGGVTLAGTRGLRGSLGARIFTTLRHGHTLMETAGDEARLTGLRFEGAYGGAERVADHSAFLSIRHYGAEVDNCEIYSLPDVRVHECNSCTITTSPGPTEMGEGTFASFLSVGAAAIPSLRSRTGCGTFLLRGPACLQCREIKIDSYNSCLRITNVQYLSKRKDLSWSS